MKRAAFVLMCTCVAVSYGAVIYDNSTGGTIWSWNWTGGPMTHTVAEMNYDGNVVIQHTGVVNNTTGAAANTRFGSKWDFTVSGNISTIAADYTMSFDLRNVSGDWNPVTLEVFVLTPNASIGADQYGRGSGAMSFAQADDWVHVEYNLAALPVGWWQGQSWDLTQSTWSMEVGMPWPGVSVADGVSFTQVWEMDNLQISMVPEPTMLVLLGLGSLAMRGKRK